MNKKLEFEFDASDSENALKNMIEDNMNHIGGMYESVVVRQLSEIEGFLKRFRNSVRFNIAMDYDYDKERAFFVVEAEWVELGEFDCEEYGPPEVYYGEHLIDTIHRALFSELATEEDSGDDDWIPV